MESDQVVENGEYQSDCWQQSTNALLDFFARIDAKPPEIIETHISKVFLGNRLVMKLKKPVRFDFLDYSSPEMRKHACNQEVVLNRRMASGVYNRVLPITKQLNGEYSLGGVGEPVEWVVEMRRLPADRMLDHLVTTGDVKRGEILSLADLFANFSNSSPTLVKSLSSWLKDTAQHIQGNFTELAKPNHGLDQSQLQRIHSRQLQFLNFESTLFAARWAAKRIIDGHGDLRPEHICLEQPPVVFDCIDFNDDFRQLDIADELSFLAMECKVMQAPWIGESILERYQDIAQDRIPHRLIHFYQSYRACVRAKVIALSPSQSPTAEATFRRRILVQSYLDIADCEFGSSSTPLVFLVRGRVGTGKSTIARSLAQALGLPLLQTDSLRNQVLGASVSGDSYAKGRYNPESRDAVYFQLLANAEKYLDQNISVVLDGCFLSLDHQRQAERLAKSHHGRFFIIDCHCRDHIARQRIAARALDPSCISQARPEFVEIQRHEDQGILPNSFHISLDTESESLVGPLEAIFAKIRSLLNPGIDLIANGDAVDWTDLGAAKAQEVKFGADN